METPYGWVSPEPADEASRACPVCSVAYSSLYSMDYGRSYENLCDECSFLKDAVEQCVSSGCLNPPEDKSFTGWTELMGPPSGSGSRWERLWWIGMGMTFQWFELFTLPGSPNPFPDFPVRNLCRSTASPEGLAQVQEWISLCEKTHVTCDRRLGSSPTLPRRVLDVSSPQVRLYETRGQSGRYVCLSHCWGDTRPSCITTSATLDANLRGIDWEIMPATFRDSIDFTRRLGLQYIWIDSMCIIQDDGLDWAEQSAQMAEFYERAYVTLCATASSNDDGGLYRTARPRWRPHKLNIHHRNSIGYDVYVTKEPRRRHISWHISVHKNRLPIDLPLMMRGWTYQERLLSPRLVHFTNGELMWECSNTSACECSQEEPSNFSSFMAGRSSKMRHGEVMRQSGIEIKEHSSIIQDHWWHIVNSYSTLDLTLEKDKLPALSGIAKQFLSCRTGDEYLAGLWRKTIITDLCWNTGNCIGRRPACWRSPSWSWAAIDGNIRSTLQGKEINQAYASCIDVKVSPAGPDPTGQVSSGFLVLDAPAMHAQLQPGKRSRITLKASGLEVNFQPDCPFDFKDGSLVQEDPLLCLRVVSYWDDFCLDDVCLVLKQSGAENTTPLYTRVGCFSHKTAELEKYWFTPGTEICRVKIL